LEKINSVLIIDDDEITTRLSRQIISKLDFAKEIKICYNGVDALDYIMEYSQANNNTCPELILI
jgi:response regulator of citrate/malate metabolism